MSSRCHCRACQERDDRRFWRIIAPLRAPNTGPRLNLPAVPVWNGTPAELTLRRNHA